MSLKERYEQRKSELLKDSSIIKYNRELFRKFFEWEEEKLKRINGITKLDEPSYKTLYGYINRFRNVNKWFKNKPWNKLTIEEIKKVYNDLEDGKIINNKGIKFGDTRSYYNKVFKAKPFKLAGLNDKVESALEFFTDKKKREVRFVYPDTFKNMVSVISNPKHLLLFWLTWDIGENINSMLQIKKKNFKRQTDSHTKEAEYLVHLPKGILKRSRQTRSEPTIFPETVKYLDIVLEGLHDDDLVFNFGYRQALKIFDSVVKRSKAKCEPNKEKPSWKDLRSGMACNLFEKGWRVEDINLRLGHSPSSKELDVYINYLAVNRKRAKKIHYSNNLEDVKNDLEESKQREKLQAQRSERQQTQIEELKKDNLMVLKEIEKRKDFDDIGSELFKDKNVQEALLKSMLKKGLGKELMELRNN